MTGNHVAANLLMLMFIVGGAMLAPSIKQEVFPEVTLDVVSITVAYPGASPEEVEDAIVVAIENEVRGIDGVKEVTANAGEGVASVSVELMTSANRDRTVNDIQQAIDRISSFPQEAEEPIIAVASNRQQVISLIIYGDTSEQALRALAEQVRDDLLQSSNITLVQLSGIRAPEISVEISQEQMRQYNLTLDSIARSIGLASIELPGGGLKTESGEVLLRVTERRDFGQEFEDISVVSRPDGTQVKVRDLGEVVDGFQDVDREAFFNGKRAVRVSVFRVGDQSPITIAEEVKTYMDEKRGDLPPGVDFAVWNDRSEIFRDRIDLLLRNAQMGLILVLVVLGLFLEIKLAFWVTLGIPISFLGAMLFMPGLDVSVNMISLFAFILTLGIVVDDAIVVGEAVYKHRQDGMDVFDAAVAGVREVAGPVVFSVLTTVIAFMPMMFLPGTMGKFFIVIPLIVIPILLLSLVESLLILPAHLSEDKVPLLFRPIVWVVRLIETVVLFPFRSFLPEETGKHRGFLGLFTRAQEAFSNFFERFIAWTYLPIARAAVSARYLSLALALSMLILTFGYIGSGAMKFSFLPDTEGDVITANVRLPFGVPVERTEEVQAHILAKSKEVLAQYGGEESLSRGIYSQVGAITAGGGPGGSATSNGSHLGQVSVFLVPNDDRTFTTGDFAQQWRDSIGEMTGVDNLNLVYKIGPSAGAPIDIELSHPSKEVLESAARELSEILKEYGGVQDIDNGILLGKEQLDLRLKPEARALGITQTDLARQVRNACFGAEVLRQQRGRDEMRVYVRLPEDERSSEYNIEELLLRTPQGGEITLEEAAFIDRGRAYTEIQRKDGRRVLHVTADVNTDVTTANDVIASLESEVLPQLLERTPGLTYTKAGEQEDQAEAMGALARGFGLALLAMFALMAVAFRSYFQPLIIMAAIPFGIVGAIIGHVIMGYGLSIMSMFGIVALAGVVVNDSLVLIDAINSLRAQGMDTFEAVIAGGQRRFRPILLTSLTTFFGLMPMIFETSVQARFLIPMALSLGFGILFVTFIALLLVPSIYMVLEDIKNLVSQVHRAFKGGSAAKSSTPSNQGHAAPHA